MQMLNNPIVGAGSVETYQCLAYSRTQARLALLLTEMSLTSFSRQEAEACFLTWDALRIPGIRRLLCTDCQFEQRFMPLSWTRLS